MENSLACLMLLITKFYFYCNHGNRSTLVRKFNSNVLVPSDVEDC